MTLDWNPPANTAATAWPIGGPSDVEVGPDGSLYIVSPSTHRVFRVTPDGIIRTFSGNGTAGVAGDGGEANAAQLAWPESVAVSPDGTVYITSLSGTVDHNGRIRRVASGTITTVAGGAEVNKCCSQFGCFCGGGGPASAANLADPSGVTVAPDGKLFIADSGTGRIYQVAPALPGLSLHALAIASEDGSTIYQFDEEGRHLATVDALTGKMLFEFDYADRLLSSITDPDGRVTIVHRVAGKLDSIESPFGQLTTFELYDNGYIHTITNPEGEQAVLEYDSQKEGLLTKLRDPKGYEFTFDYENDGRLKKHTDPVQAGGERNFARSFLADGGFKVDVTTETAGVPLLMSYALENLMAGGQKRTTILPDGLTATTEIQPGGARTTVFPDGTTTTLVETGDTRFGMQAPVVSSLQTTTGGLTQTVGSSRTYTGTWPMIQGVTDEVTVNGRTLRTTIDLAGSLAKITRQTHGGRTSITELDVDGRPIKTSVVVPPNHPIQLYPTELVYYPSGLHKGRLYQATQGTGPDARTYTFTYDDTTGYLQSITDPLDRVVLFQTDGVGRLKNKTFPDGSTVEFVHDANGNMAKLAPPRLPGTPLPPDAELHVFDHGALDFLSTYTPPELTGLLSGSTMLSYTPNRLLDVTTKPINLTIDPEYDAWGRLHNIGGQTELSFGYYDLNQPADHRGKLQAVTFGPMTSDEVTLTQTYQGSLPKGITWSGAVSGHIEWTYDNDFRVTSETIAGTAPVVFQYNDADGLLTDAGALHLNIDSKTGVLLGTQIGNLTDTYEINAFGELVGYVAQVSGAPVYAMQYSVRDKLGRVVRKTEAVGAETAVPYEYHYNDADQLTDVFQGEGPCDPSTCAQLGHYEYDLNGNRTLVQHGSGPIISDIQHDAQDRLTKHGEATYYHFANGERSQKTVPGQGTTKYTWDVFGNLRRLELPAGIVIDYIIDGQNRRVGKKLNGVLVKGWLYDGLVPVAELDGSQAIVARFVYATKGHVPDYMIKDGNTYRLITDQLGSVRLVVDVQTREVKQRIDYDEFGGVVSDSNPGFQPFGFAGGLYDPATGLVRFGARDYDAETGRWLAKDPILFAGGDTNLYAYAGNDPINFTDPDGLMVKNVAMDSALGGGLLSWLGFGTLAEGLKNRADGLAMMSNAGSFELGLAKYRQGICQIGAGYMQASGTMMILAGAVTVGAELAANAAFSRLSIKWLGNNPGKMRVITSARMRGYVKTTTDMPGGRSAAEALFEKIAGMRPTGHGARFVGDEIEVVFRVNSKSGTPAVEIINHLRRTHEKIHFLP